MTLTLSRAFDSFQLDALSSARDSDYAEERRWVLAARKGDETAVMQLLGRYRPPLVRLLHGVTGSLPQAEDLAQEAFLQAFRCLGQLRDPAAFYPWLRRLALRQAMRTPRRAETTAREEEGSQDPRTGIETRLAVQGLLSRMPTDLRTVLVLRELEGLDYAEIAAALEIPLGTVRSRLFTARERFRVLWMEMEGSTP